VTWFKSPWVIISHIFMCATSLFVGIATGAGPFYLLSQVLMHTSVYLSLSLLRTWPLVNPAHFVIFLFYWWISVAPIVIGLSSYLTEDISRSVSIQDNSVVPILITCFGLLLFSICSRITLRFIRQVNLGLKALLPIPGRYTIMNISILLSIGAIATLILGLSQAAFGMGIEETDYLGGQKTTVWWMGLLQVVAQTTNVTSSVIISAYFLCEPKDRKKFRLLAIVVLAIGLFTAITSGWKGAFVSLFMYLIIAYVATRQRIPWRAIVLLAVLYLFVIEPFVSFGRVVAQNEGITSSEDRKRLFLSVLASGDFLNADDDRGIQIESPFRGIAIHAAQITKETSLFNGAWHGRTVISGLESLVPRAIYPGKPDSDTGALYAREIGYRAGVSSKYTKAASAVSVPFDIVMNWGWLSGVLCFGVLGFIWTFLCGLTLTERHMSNHPMNPYILLISIGLEGTFGSFAGRLRNGFIVIAIMVLVLSAISQQKKRTRLTHRNL